MIMYFFSSFPEDKTNMQKDSRPELANIQWSEKVQQHSVYHFIIGMQIAEKSLPAFTESLQVAYSHLSCLQV
jgi:hypothetical protein